MSEQEFETYLALLGRMLRLSPAQRESIAGELRDHMQERLVELHEQGIARDKAVRMALEEFGDAAALAREFALITRTRRRRWMMRLTAGSFAAALAVLMAVMTFWPDPSTGPAPQTATAQQNEDQAATPRKVLSEQENNAITQRRLDDRIDAEFEDVPLNDVLQFLVNSLDVQFYIDKRALDDIGVEPNATASLKLREVRAGMALEIILEQMDLAYKLRDGILVITTPEELEANLEVRVYNCRDLLAFGPPAHLAGSADVYGGGGANDFDGDYRQIEPAPPGSAQPAGQSPSRGASQSGGFFGAIIPETVLAQGFGGGTAQPVGGLGGSGGFGGGSGLNADGGARRARPRPATPDEIFNNRADDLIQLITTTIEPDSWDSVGGPGAISQYSGLIVVSQTQPIHDQIDSFLKMLRQSVEEALASEQRPKR